MASTHTPSERVLFGLCVLNVNGPRSFSSLGSARSCKIDNLLNKIKCRKGNTETSAKLICIVCSTSPLTALEMWIRNLSRVHDKGCVGGGWGQNKSNYDSHVLLSMNL